MRAQKRKIALVVTVLLVGWGSYAWADVAATVTPGGTDFSALIWFGGNPTSTDYHTIGWRFFVDEPIVVTHLGLFDFHDNGLSCTHKMGIWRVKKTGGLQLERQVDIGPGGVTEGHHVWAALAEPFTINPDPIPYVLNGVEYYERWLVGVWTGAGNTEELILSPPEAITLDAAQAGVIRLQNYTFYRLLGVDTVTEFPADAAHYYSAPWGATESYYYFGVNFKYSLLGPAANAGPDVEIYTSEQALTTIAGTGTHSAPGTALEYRWLEEGAVLQDWTAVGVDGAANLSLAEPVPAFSIGEHTLTLEVKDTTTTASDTMTLTVSNTPPEGQPTPANQVLQIGLDAIIIAASVADFDGDAVSYQWVKDGAVIESGTITPQAGGTPVEIDDLIIPAGDPRFPLGSNEVQFVVNDGLKAVTETVTIMIEDTTAPTVAPTPGLSMLWPANHALVPVTISVYTEDNGGGTITLSATVQSNEPEDDGGDGSTEQDCYVDSIDNAAGTVLVQLRAERSGTGTGRVYTITITAADGSGNQSEAIVDVRVPHDRKKK